MVELPLVVIDVQRAGPSTGMPTKNEQADLLQVMFGRNSDSPLPIVAPATPGECFDLAIEACRLALKYMTPVVYLSDAFLATGSEPWQIPSYDDLPRHRRRQRDRPGDLPAVPARSRDAGPAVGRAGHARARAPHRRSREGRHHGQRQLRPGQPPPDAALRQAKVAGIANDIPPLDVFGPDHGELLILGWGSTYGAIRSAVERLTADGRSVAHAHLRHLNPFPANTEDVLRALQARAHPGGQPGPAADADPGPLSSSTPSATTRSAASRSASPRSWTRPNASSPSGAS